jgi:hypothetical protein
MQVLMRRMRGRGVDRASRRARDDRANVTRPGTKSPDLSLPMSSVAIE